MLSRRNLVFAAGSATVALVGTGGLFAVTRTPHHALKPWTDAVELPPSDVRLDAFRHAILAPNPHNRQPWLIRLVGDSDALIYCDLDRRLPQTDPFDRQILLGFGCFLELARIAAAERGAAMSITAFPEGVPGERLDARPIARLSFKSQTSISRDPLFASIANRGSSKQVFDTARPIAPSLLNAIVASNAPGVSLQATADAEKVRNVRGLTWDAWMVEFQTQRTWQETVDLMRIGRSEIEANPDGVSIGGPFLEAMALAGQVSRSEMARPGSIAHRAAIDRYQPILATSMAFAWITTNGNTRSEQLAAGQAYVRMNLEAARMGVGFHPLSQALQEFPEMAASFAKVHSALGAMHGQRIQMLVRLGYGGARVRTPRWPLETRLMRT